MMRILIIKLSALGDVLHAMPVMEAIKKQFPKASLSIMTTAPFQNLLMVTGWFETCFVTTRPKWWEIKEIRSIFSILNQKWDYIIDLQGTTRTTFYGRFQKNPWIGTQTFGDFPYNGPPPHDVHPHKRFHAQLSPIHIDFDINTFSLNFMSSPLDKGVNIPSSPYVVLIPGASAAHQGKKKWPLECYGNLSLLLKEKGLNTVLVGGKEESFLAINAINPHVIDLSGKTNLTQLIHVFSKAELAVGNDTGPTIMASYCQIPTLTLYSGVTKTYQGGACTKKSYQLIENDLSHLNVEKVAQALSTIDSQDFSK